MKTSLVILASVLLALSVIGMAIGAEVTKTATVTVNSYSSITLTDAGTAGINFGSWDPNTNDKPDADQTGSTPAIRVTNDAVSNTNIKVNVKGTDFTGNPSGNMPVGNATYDDDNTPSQGGSETGKAESSVTTAYPVTDYYTGIAPGNNADFWFYIDIPSNQVAATYSSTFTFKGVA